VSIVKSQNLAWLCALRQTALLVATAFVIVVSGPLALAPPAFAQEAPSVQGQIIEEIEVTGNQRIETLTVLSYVTFKVGDPYRVFEIDRSLKALFFTSLFADVRIVRQGNKVIVEVVENPIINRVVIEGNKAVDDEDIFEEIKLRPRLIYTRAMVEADMQSMIELYRRSGRFAVQIEPKIVKLQQNRVDLVFEVNEGPVTGIRRINFLGNEAFSDRTLRGVIVTDESRWWNLFTSNDNFDPDRMTYDKEVLRQYYESKGYANFRVTSAVAELTPDRKGFFITFTVDEGEQFRFGKGTIDTTLEDINADFLQGLIEFESGEIYNADKIDETIETLTFWAGMYGYAFVDIKPNRRVNNDEQVVDVVFRMKEGPRVYVERIDIIGNTRTLDRVIRRQMQISEGDAYNRVRLDNSKARVQALRYFETVEIEEIPGTAADKTQIQVKVKEQPTGEFSFGVGFSSTDNVAGDLSISERNLLGRGQVLRFRLSGSNRRQQVDISFTEPNLFGRNLVAGFDIYQSTTNFRREAGYNLASTGGVVRSGFPLTLNSQLALSYTFKTDEIDAPGCLFGGNISSVICNEIGTRSTSMVSYTYSLDKRNNPVRPTNGYNFVFKQDLAGIGGDATYVKTEIIMTGYKKLYFDKVIGSAKWNFGFIESLNDEVVRLSDRYRKGGNSFRGFDISGVGPRDVSRVSADNLKRGDSLGGQAFGIATFEVGFPTGLPESYGIDAALFAEVGTLGYISDDARQKMIDQIDQQNEAIDAWNANPVNFGNPQFPLGSVAAPDIRDDLSWRSSVGVSVYWDSPFGPIRLDFAQVLSKEDYDRTESFRFSAGRRF
jgi:outer membrane protein insertion porin family